MKHSRPQATWRVLSGLSALVVGGGLAACSASGSSDFGGAGAGGNGNGNGGDQSGTGSSGPLFGGGGDGAGSGLGSGSATGFGGGTDNSCAGEVHQGERLPLDMYFLVDQSGSMNEPVTGGSKWSVVTGSLIAFLNDPVNAGSGAGIGYFPYNGQANCSAMPTPAGCACIPFINICFSNVAGSCNVPDYANPDVAIAMLPQIAPNMVTSIQGHGPGGGTPTEPALQGAYQYAASWAQANPGRKTVLVLATDGDPTGCGGTNNPTDIANNVVGPAFSGTPSIPTFVIGVGTSLTSLNALAAKGGTGQAFIVDTGGNVAQQFADALNQIRGQAVPCDFVIPTETSKGKVDPSLVNVVYTPKGATQAQIIAPVVDSKAANCGPQGGWYYDDPAAPKTIKMCDATCTTLKQGGQIDVQLGCATVPPTIQ